MSIRKRNSDLSQKYVTTDSTVARTSPTPIADIIDAFKANTLITAVKEQDGWLLTSTGKWIVKTPEVIPFREWTMVNPDGVLYDERGNELTSFSNSIPTTQAQLYTGATVIVTKNGVGVPDTKVGESFIVTGTSGGGNVQIQSTTTNDTYTVNYSALTVYDPATSSFSAASNPSGGTADTQTLAEQMTFNMASQIRQDRSHGGSYETPLVELATHAGVGSLRGVFGMPYQFLPQVDPRVNGRPGDMSSTSTTAGVGRMYLEKVLSKMPILVLQAGVPLFLQGFDQNEKQNILSSITGGGFNLNLNPEEANLGSKYYSFEAKPGDYFNIVNMQCTAMANLLQIGDIKISYDGAAATPIYQIRWQNHSGGSNENNGEKSFFGKNFGYSAGSVCFYVNAEPQSTDSFNNGTSQSQLASMMNNIGRTGSELQFLMGGASGQLAKATDGDVSIGNQTEKLTQSTSTGSIIDNMIGNISTLLAGGRMAFPEIWSDSTLMRSYTVTIKLESPDADTLSVFLNILVPLSHILAFIAPRSIGYNNYIAPFLVRAFYKSMFHIDMGIITDCQIQKGDVGCWTTNGLPTQVNVTLTIKDLYDVMSVAGVNGTYSSLLSNPIQLDYIANLCGINYGEPSLRRTADLFGAIFRSEISLDSFMARMSMGGSTGLYRMWNNLWTSRTGYTM